MRQADDPPQAAGRAAGTSPSIWPIRLVFLFQSLAFGSWLPRIPDFKIALQIDDGALGLALAGLPAGSMLGFAVAGRFAEFIGPRRAAMVAGPFFALTFVVVGLAGSVPALFGALFLSGIAVALIETAMSSKAGQYEQVTGRRIMSQCHGFWSIGSVAGALMGGLFSQFDIAPLVQFSIVNPVLALMALVVAAATRPDPPGAAPSHGGRPTLPAPALLLLIILPAGIMATEGAVMDWSAVFMRDVLASPPLEAAVVYAVFSTAMAVMRLSGDRLAERFGARTVIMAAATSAAAGLLVFALAPHLVVALAGAILMGAGVAPIFPLVVSAAAAAPGRSSEANVNAASFVAFVVFLATPPLIGGVATLLDLRVAFLLLVPFVALTAVLAARSAYLGGRSGGS